MPPALSPGGRLRSRTSDISDLLRGRHDTKTSTDAPHPPPIPPRTPDPTTPQTSTPQKLRGKFSFLARKRKPSAPSPVPARAAAEAAQRVKGKDVVPPVPPVDASAGSHLPSPRPLGDYQIFNGSEITGASSSSHKRSSSSLPPVDVPPSLALPAFEGSSSKSDTLPRAAAHQRIPSGIPTATLRNLRAQKSTSFEQSRRSDDSQARKHSSSSSSRPIITISPPHGVTQGTDPFYAPRSAPRPPGQLSSRQSIQSGAPAVKDQDKPDSPTSASEAGSHTSVRSSMQFPIPAVDTPVSTSSYKEENLLRKDHFEIGPSDIPPGQRRGTVSGINQSTFGSVGRSSVQERQQRRHVSILHMGKPKQEAGTSTPPRVVRRPSAKRTESPSTSGQSGNESTASSRGIGVVVSPLLRSSSSRSSPTPAAAAKKVPPPLARTWHTPPTTGPPTEPLPSPPSSAALQPLLLSSTHRASLGANAAATSPPPSPQKTLPPLPPKDGSGSSTPSTATPKATSSAGQGPPSPARSSRERDVSSPPPPARTPPPMRQDAVRAVLENENATAEELRAALGTQTAKYSRLMAYLLTLTERHGMEKNEFLRRIEALEADAVRRERELKGLRWLVANANSGAGQQGERRAGAGMMPARADSSTLPAAGRGLRSRQRSASESIASPMSASVNVFTLGIGAEPSTGPNPGQGVRVSIDSPAGSTEDGLLEMQTAISELIAPFVSPPLGDALSPGERAPVPSQSRERESLSAAARLRRSNTLPDALAHLPTVVSSKQARRTSSPVLPVSNGGSPAAAAAATSTSTGAPMGRRTGATTGLGFGFEPSSQSPSPPRSERDRDRDPHARSDSSTLSSVPTLSSFASSSALSSIPETPRTEMEFAPARPRKSSSTKHSEDAGSGRGRRLSGSSLASSRSSGSLSGSGSAGGSSRVSTSPSIAQVLDRGSRQPEMDAILRRLRAFGQQGSP